MLKKSNGDIVCATVKELMEMMDRKELLTDISTQRKFVYAFTPTTIMLDNGEEIAVNKSTSMMTYMLNNKGQLPGIVFWHVEGEEDNSKNHLPEENNLHDGLQRLSTIYRYYHPVMRDDKPIVAYINGTAYTYRQLPPEYKDYLDNYEFTITTCHGTSEQEENSFGAINSNVLALEPYERLHGSYHGTFFDGFEAFIERYRKTGMFRDKMLEVGRGTQAIFLLYTYLHRVDKSGKSTSIINDTRAKQEIIAGSVLHDCRNDLFDETKYKFMDKINAYFKLTNIPTLVGGDHSQLLRWQIVDYIFTRGYNINTVIDYYEGSISKDNDLNKWKLGEHMTAIDNLFLTNPIYCDYTRFFNKKIKSELFTVYGQTTCQMCGKALEYDEAEVDHIDSWSEGGRTVLANAQLLCKPCNAAKGGKNRI